MAYLVLPGDLGGPERLVQAHWIVYRSMPRRARAVPVEELYGRLRGQVLRRAMRPPRGARPRLGPWLRLQPAVSSDEDLTLAGELSRLGPEERTAYVLLHLESLPADTVLGVLAELKVRDPAATLRAAAAVDERMPRRDQDILLARPPLDPTITRLYGRRVRPVVSRSAMLGTVIAGVLIAGLVAAAGYPGTDDTGPGASRGPVERVSVVEPDMWRHTTRLDLETWPARGDLVDDSDFVREALRAWNGSVRPVTYDGASAVPPSLDPQLLYAGSVGGRRVALLHDSERVARYTTGDGKDALEVFPEGRSLPGAASPLKLAPGRLLLPPWVTAVKAAQLGGGRARWRRIQVRQGVTDPVEHSTGQGCWRGAVLEFQQPAIAHGRPYTMVDLGGLTAANILYQPPPPAGVRRLGPRQIDTAPEAAPRGFELWGRLACAASGPAAVADRGGSVESATAWEFWKGGLPGGGGRGRWVCTRFGLGDGRSATYTTLLDSRGATVTGQRSNSWDCSRLQRDVASSTWWRSPKGRWYYLAAASRRVVALTAEGPFKRPEVSKGLLAAPGPKTDRPPDGPVTVKAVNYLHKAMPLFQPGNR